jgi:ribosomal-protein-serine acetyltransferase
MVHVEVDQNLTLEIIVPADKIAIYNLVNKNREYIGSFLPWVEATKDETDILNFIKNSCDQLKEMTGVNYKILMDNEIIGAIGFFINNIRTKTFEIGYWIDKDKSGKGIVTKLIPFIENICFQYFEAQKIEIRCAIQNIGSNRIAHKCNYSLEGTLKNADIINGKLLHYNIYGKCKD